MLSINNIFDIADSAMTANQAAMNTVSQNVANVNTPFYNSETPIENAAPAVVGAPYTYGTGVNVTQIQRTTNDFVQSEVNAETTQNNFYTTQYQGLDQIQNLFNDQSGSGFSSQISTFFNDFQNVANNPSDTSQRTVLLSDANSLSGSINNAYSTIMNTVSSTNNSISGVIPQINNLTSQIATLNQQISYAINAGSNANELQDQQMQALNSLSKITNVSYYGNGSGGLSVSLGNNVLVSGNNSYNLSTEVDSSSGANLNIMWNGPGGYAQNITNSITGGSLGAYVNLEQVQAPSYINQLNSLSAAVTDNVNSLQYNGYGLDGSTGNYFFNPNLTTAAGSGVKDATISTGTVTNPADLTGDNYTISTTGGGVFSVVNNTTGKTLSNAQVNTSSAANNLGQSVYTIAFDGISVDITGTSTLGTPPAGATSGGSTTDTFTVNQLTKNPAQTMSVNSNLTASQIAAASAVSTAVSPNNTGNATIGSGSVINPTAYTNGTGISNSNEGGQYNITYVASALSAPATSGGTSITINGNFQNNSNSQDNFQAGQQILIGNTAYTIASSSGSVIYNGSSNNTTTINLASPGLSSSYVSGASVGAFAVNNTTTGKTQYLAVSPSLSSSGQNSYSLSFGNQNNIGAAVSAQNFNVAITGIPLNGDTFTANVLSPMSNTTPYAYATHLTLSNMNSIGLSGNNENALNLGALQNNNVSIGSANTTISSYYSSIVSNIGTQSQNSNTNYTNSTSVLTNLQNQLQSFVGVNMNQQMTDLVNYQNSYQAAAAITNSAEAIMTALLSIVP